MLKLRRNQSISTAGFTLPELLIVIVMAGILALIATPSWVAMVNNRRATTVRDTIIQGFRVAQDQAERDRVPVSVTLNTQSPNIEVRYPTAPLTDPPLFANPLIREGIPANLVTITTTPPGNTLTLTYNPSGALDNLPGSPTRVVVTVGTSRRCVVVENLLGAMRSLDGNTDCPVP